VGTYRALTTMVARGALDASRVTAFQLDEYLGLEPGDRRSLGRWARDVFVDPLGLGDDRFVTLPLDGAAALADHDRRVREEGGYDLAILGIGENGHLGFNEPPSDPAAASRVVALSTASVASNTGYWGDAADVPRRAVTVGLGPSSVRHDRPARVGLPEARDPRAGARGPRDTGRSRLLPSVGGLGRRRRRSTGVADARGGRRRAVKMTLLGTGVRTPFVLHGLADRAAELGLGEVVLHDVDRDRLETMTALGGHLVRSWGGPFTVSSETDARRALTGSRFVFSAIRVGRERARALDEQIALKHGVLGQGPEASRWRSARSRRCSRTRI
jgi:hypothetical protein